MATTIDYASDYDGGVSDYQTTMPEKPAGDYRLCPLREMATSVRVAAGGVPMESATYCDGPRCAWWDADKSRCAVLSLARNK